MIPPEVVQVEATVHGRTLVQAPPGDGPFPLLLGFHGYGEDAAAMLPRLLGIPGGETWVRAAIQALHPFYNTRSGEVVASWMTKLDRELAIADNLAYVRQVIATLRSSHAAEGQLVIAGFSQGVAMAYRAAALAGSSVAALIAVGGDLPPELRDDAALASIPRALVARGADDAWYTAEKLAADVAALERAGVAVTRCEYAGGHVWTAEIAAAAGELVAAIPR